MKSDKKDAPLDLGIYGQKVKPGVHIPDIIAAVLSVVWVAFIALFWFFLGGSEGAGPTFNPMIFVMTLVSILLPIALIWMASSVAKTGRVMREESQRLQSAIDAMRHAYVTQQQTAGQVVKPSLEERLGEIAHSQRQTQTALATFTSRRDTPAPGLPSTMKVALTKKETSPPAPKEQASLALDTPPAGLADPITIAEFIRAMNFPENEDDQEGFRTLRRALEDRDIAKMIRASQDVLTLLSQDGIYMDDLKPRQPSAEVWRRFANGARGQEVAEIGGIRDRSCLALTSGRMKKDSVFRDAAHHFLRQFDSVLSEFESNATDEELSKMGETRTARAFMLLGSAAGTFE